MVSLINFKKFFKFLKYLTSESILINLRNLNIPKNIKSFENALVVKSIKAIKSIKFHTS